MMTAMSGKFLSSPNPAELAENGPNRYLNITDPSILQTNLFQCQTKGCRKVEPSYRIWHGGMVRVHDSSKVETVHRAAIRAYEVSSMTPSLLTDKRSNLYVCLSVCFSVCECLSLLYSIYVPIGHNLL